MDVLPSVDRDDAPETALLHASPSPVTEQQQAETGEAQQTDAKPWDKKWTLGDLRSGAREWNLAHDYGV